jgi:predicted nucleic acid-binding protein
VIGKFISVDPVIEYTQPQQINGYAYANNSPVTHADPSGMILADCNYGVIECIGGKPVTSTTTDPKVTQAQSDYSVASANLAGAQQQQASAKQRIKSAGKALVKIARDLLGVDAALDCISSGDVGACGETVLNIAGSFAGGLAGKILAKYGAPWDWAKGFRLAKRVTGLVGDLIGGAKDLWKANKAVGRASAGLSKAADKLADARKKAAEAFRKRKKTECHSFLPGTKVLLAGGGTKPIEKVKLGDKVVTTDPKTGKTTVREVAGTIVTEDDKDFSDLTVKTASGKTQALVATTTHPFWVESEGAWIEAGDLKPGMKLSTPAGDTAEVTANRHFDKRQRTHDLTVTGIHAYYVLAGATPVLVHNCGEVAVDTNAVTDALSGAKTAEVDAALAGRAPVLSPTAHRELLEGGHSADAIGGWLSERGGRMGAASTSEGVASLQARLRGMWKGKSFNPMIADDDASVLHSAIQDGLSIITNDKRFYKNIERLGYSSERY